MDLEELKSLAKQLPEHQPTEDGAQALRDTLLAAVNKEQIRKRVFSPWLAAAAVAAAAAIAFFAGSRSASSPTADSITVAASPVLTSPDGAQFDRHSIEVDGKNVEEVRLHGGSLRVATEETQHPLRVVTKNALLQGTSSFSVEATEDELRAVHVQSGRLQVVIDNQPPIVLGPGESWVKPETQLIELAVRAESDQEGTAESDQEGTAESDQEGTAESDQEGTAESDQEGTPESDQERTADATVKATNRTVAAAKIKQNETVKKPMPRFSPGASLEPESAAPVETENPVEDTDSSEQAEEPEAAPIPSTTELAFDAGYRAVKRGDYAQGLRQLALAIAETDDTDLRADARYWRIVALARSGRATLAQRAMQEFLQVHKADSRGGEVATMLGWIYVEQGKTALARPLFEKGSTDASLRVRDSAQAGLETITK